MITTISKPRIPKKYVYILKTKQLEDLLAENNIDIHIDLQYWLPQIIGSIFEVHFWTPRANIPYNRLYIRAGGLPKEDSQLARITMAEIVLPQFLSWLKPKIALLENTKHLHDEFYFNAEYKNGEVYIK